MGETVDFEPAAVRERYLAERDKRLLPGRAEIRDLDADARVARYREDPFTPFVPRDPIDEDLDAVIVGAGIAGVCVGARLREAGLDGIRMLDEAGGIGGTWYWNRYPGLMCDVESYIYLPMLEEMGYIPSDRYAKGEEIRRHVLGIADRYDLTGPALMHTKSESSTWDPDLHRWVVRTDRGDTLRARYLVLATGILNLMKIPQIDGMEDFAGPSFHTARWDYDVTGGDGNGGLHELAGKTVALMGVGGSGIQVLPHLAEAAERVYVFQRTPSPIGVRDNRPTPAGFTDDFGPGWQRRRMENFQSVMLGLPVDDDLVDDAWCHNFARTRNMPRDPAWTASEYAARVEEVDYEIMEEHRSRIDEIVEDPRTAEALKPWYRYLCKRPLFHDEYLAAFNRPNVTLVDCPAGVDRITATGVVVEGDEIELDCIIYATGFEGESTPLARRVRHEVVGRDGVTLAEKWGDGARSLWGMTSRGFPNMFIMPAPFQQAVVTVNYTHVAVEGAEHIAAVVRALDDAGIEWFDVEQAAEDRWVQAVVDRFVDASALMSMCTPSRINNEGHPEDVPPSNGNYGGGLGDFFGYRDLLAAWRDAGGFEGFELHPAAPTRA
jgi:cation diffusion facilitator CzcD-associated flavoprotein CzcO